MQIHSGGQTLFAFNRWNSNDVADLGIGNQPDVGQEKWHPDWTFANNANKYTLKSMKILVSPSVSAYGYENNIPESEDYVLV